MFSFSGWFVILVILGLIAWYGTAFLYDLLFKVFQPIEPEKRERSNKQIISQSQTTEMRTSRIIMPDFDNKKRYRVNADLIKEVEYYTIIRGGRGNAKLMTFHTIEDD